MAGWMGGWLEKLKIRLNSASVEVEVEVEAELGKIEPQNLNGESLRKFEPHQKQRVLIKKRSVIILLKISKEVT